MSPAATDKVPKRQIGPQNRQIRPLKRHERMGAGKRKRVVMGKKEAETPSSPDNRRLKREM